MHYEIVPARPRHVAMLRRALREEERAEITCFVPEHRVGTAMLMSLGNSIVARAAFLDGKIAAVGGLVGSLLDDEVGGWLLTTPIVTRAPIQFVKQARAELVRAAGHRTVIGQCAAFHTHGLRFLQMIGFRIADEIKAPLTGEVFYELRFKMNGS